MKRQIIAAVVAGMLTASALLFPLMTPIQAASQESVVYQPYVGTGELYIQTPKAKETTKVANISILGAANPAYDLTINGKQYETTSSGFFAAYVPLKIGTNTLVIKNNGKTKTLQVIREKAVSTSVVNNQTIGDIQGQYGIVKTNNITHRQAASQKSQLLAPLAIGTAVAITGQSGEYYRLVDGSFIFKDAVDLFQNPLPQNTLQSVYLHELGPNGVTLGLRMSVNALYQVQLQGDGATLTLYDTKPLNTTQLPKNPLITDMKLVSNPADRHAVYQISFVANALVNGYDVVQQDQQMLLNFKQAPILAKDSLAGARILLDAGHGGSDPGALGPAGSNGPTEKDINIQITQYAKDYLESQGATVIMNRLGDEYRSLGQRSNDIVAARPDVMLSIHANSAANTANLANVAGFLTYYTFEKDLAYATAINEQVAEQMGFVAKTPNSSNLALTRTTTCPAALLETRFMSNPNDYEWLIKSENQQALGQAIGQAVAQYLYQNSRIIGE